MHSLNCQCSKCRRADSLEYEQFEFPGDPELYGETELESPFSEAEEIDLAAELLSVSNEEELDQFLGKLLKGAWKGLKKVGSVVGKIAKPLGGVLKGVAKAALPLVGGALGSFIPIPGVGTALGSALGGALSKALEMEFAELNQEEREFEMARRFVRLAGTAAQKAALASPSVDPQAAVKSALIAAARRHVGSLPDIATVGNDMTGAAPKSARSGQWVRRGREISVLGV
ncbi:MAG: hypothetical protein H0U97_08595 [Gammaproteobacteria bacterium]|nr:hypothetical protein [Gammaproteobacteria bacterium]